MSIRRPGASDTDAAWSRLGEHALAEVERVDAARLEVERSRVAEWVAAGMVEPTHGVRGRFRAWEALTYRMGDGWAPDGRYVIEEYLNDLETRDALGEVVADLDAPVLTELLRGLDVRFTEFTVHDGGAELRPYYRRLREGQELSWIWYRRPAHPPWR